MTEPSATSWRHQVSTVREETAVPPAEVYAALGRVERWWSKDKWGVSWQITPQVLIAALCDPDRAAAKRAFEAMMPMKKIDIAAIEAARRG